MADYVQHRGGQDVRDEDVLHALADASLHNGQPPRARLPLA